MKHVGKVVALKYSEGDEYPRLQIDSSGYSSLNNPDGYAIANMELIKIIRRTLATGDVVECAVKKTSNDIVELTSFRIIQQKEPKPGEVRKLTVDHWSGQFDDLDIAGAEPGEVDISRDDLLEQGEAVFSLTWDAQYPGGSGVLSIVRLGSTYFYSAEEGVFGPFPSLKDALDRSELDTFGSATESIECSVMDNCPAPH